MPDKNEEELIDLKSPEGARKAFKEVFKNNLRFQMWGLFSMYPELTLADLSEKLGKSKSTIHPHLKVLEELEIIEEIREEKVRGNIKAKVYKLRHDYEEKLTKWEKSCKCEGVKELTKEMGRNKIEESISRVKIMQRTLDIELKFYEKLRDSGIDGPDEYALQLVNEMYTYEENKRSEVYDLYDYMSYPAYEKYREFFQDLFYKINDFETKEIQENPEIEKPFHFFAHMIPLKRMLEYLYPKKK